MERLELLAPAGSFEAVTAAVQNGADAVYMGFGDFNARRGAKNLSQDEMEEAIDYCRLRGVKTHITLNTLLTDRELLQAEEIVRQVNRIGADAVIVADWGLARLIRQVAPELSVHASTQTTIHSLEGAQFAAEHGFTRVVLARELNREQIAFIAKHAPVEVEVFAHGALCMSYSGQCYLSGVIGGRSGNRGLCAQPCRMPYRFNGNTNETYPLSLKDLCMADRLAELAQMGVTSVKLEGRMKRPEYVAIVTNIYAKLLRDGRKPTEDELRLLEQVFSRQGFTDGYYRGKPGPKMFGVRPQEREVHTLNKLYKEARESYKGETPRVDVRFYCILQVNERAILAAEDTDGNRFIAKGPIVERARTRSISSAAVRDQLHKTGGTPFRCAAARVRVSENAAMPLSALNAMRRECLDKLADKRLLNPKRPEGKFLPGFQLVNQKEPPVITASVMQLDQVSRELMDLHPALVSIPLMGAAAEPKTLADYAARAPVAVTLPRIIKDDERAEVMRALRRVKECGVHQVMIGNVGQFAMAQALGFTVRCDFGLNVFNSQTLKELKQAGAASAVLSPELTFPQIRDIRKGIDTELIVYGRIPVMLTENCVVKSQSGHCICKNVNQLTDRTGAVFPLVSEYPHRNSLLNSKKLFWADRSEEYRRLGVWGARLLFTTENSKECVQVLERYLGLNESYAPTVFTRGLYRRGVE